MAKKTCKNLPIYEYDEKVNGQTRYYCRPYINGKQTTIRLDENGNMWLGRDGYQNLIFYLGTITKGCVKPKTDLTFKQMFYEMQEYNALHCNNSLTTRMEYESKMKNHIFNLDIANKKISKWTAHDYENIVVKLKETVITSGSKKGQSLNIRTINAICRIISAVFEYSKNFYDIKKNIVKEVGYMHENRDEVVEYTIDDLLKQNKSITDNEWDLFVQASKDIIEQELDIEKKVFFQSILLLITCEYVLFLRVGEAQGLKWKNLYENCYVLYEAWNKKLHKTTPLKNRDKRLLYVPHNLITAFNKLRSLQQQYKLYQEDGFIFGGIKPVSRASIDRFRNKACKEAGIKQFSNHFLRHAGESYALANKVDPTTIATMAGHRLQMMLDTYISTIETSNKYMVQTLNQIQVPFS